MDLRLEWYAFLVADINFLPFKPDLDNFFFKELNIFKDLAPENFLPLQDLVFLTIERLTERFGERLAEAFAVAFGERLTDLPSFIKG